MTSTRSARSSASSGDAESAPASAASVSAAKPASRPSRSARATACSSTRSARAVLTTTWSAGQSDSHAVVDDGGTAGRVQRHDLSRAPQLLERRGLGAGGEHVLVGCVGVVRQHLAPQRDQPLRRAAADAAEADHAGDRAGQLASARDAPVAAPHPAVSRRHAAEQREQQCDGVLGHGLAVGPGRVGHDDAGARPPREGRPRRHRCRSGRRRAGRAPPRDGRRSPVRSRRSTRRHSRAPEPSASRSWVAGARTTARPALLQPCDEIDAAGGERARGHHHGAAHRDTVRRSNHGSSRS